MLESRPSELVIAQALRDAESRYRGLVEHIPVVVYLRHDEPRATFGYISPQVEDLLGVTPAALLEDGELWYACIHPEDVQRVQAEASRCHAQGVEFDCQYRMVARDGSVRHVWEREAPRLVPDGDHGALARGVVMDVTALRRSEEALRTERDRAQRYLDLVGGVLLALDADGRIAMLNRAGYAMLGYDEGTLHGADWFATCVPPATQARARETLDEFAASGRHAQRVESTVVCSDGSTRTVVWQITGLRDAGRPGRVLCSGVDITERLRAEEQIAYLAYHDSLTGLPNRMMLQEHLELALARGRRHRCAVALLYLDLDDFKLVNDTLGHAAGDELLCQVAARIRRHVREPDTLARQGGDEFLVLLADLANDGERRAMTAAQHIVDAVREPYRIGGIEFEIGVSVGVALFPDDAQDAVSLLEHADAAMYAAKAEGRGQVRIFSSVAEHRESGVELLSEGHRLRRAIEGGELVLHWQPLVGLADRAILGVEALLRWNDGERGIRPASEFVPVAERAGLLDAIDEFVIAAVARQRRAWQAEGLDPRVSFNLSPLHLRPERTSALLDGLRAGGSLDHVTIELTEGSAMLHDRSTTAVLSALRAAGVQFALDDFGVAYSSLRRLAELPVRWIKVERSFVRDVPDSEHASRLLQSIVGLIDALGLVAVIEGVETEEQAAHLAACGLTLGQGHHLGEPMPAAALEPLLHASPRARIARG